MVNKYLSRADSYKNLSIIVFFHLSFVCVSIFLIINFSLLISIPLFIVIAFIHQKFMGEFLHEGCHSNLQKNGFLNEIVSNYLVGICIFITVNNYRKLHFKHHKFTSFFEGDDPETGFLKIYKKSDFWKNVALDLLGYNALKMLRDYSLNEKDESKFSFKIDKVFYIYVLIHFCVFVLLVIYNFYLFYLIYYLTLGTLSKLQRRFVVLCQHIFIKEDNQKVQYEVTTSRTIVGNFVETIFFNSDINGYHDLHHENSMYPYRKLKKMFDESEPKEEINTFSTTRFHIIKKYYNSLL